MEGRGFWEGDQRRPGGGGVVGRGRGGGWEFNMGGGR